MTSLVNALTGTILLTTLLGGCGGGGSASQSSNVTSTSVNNSSSQTSTNGNYEPQSIPVIPDAITTPESVPVPVSTSSPLPLNLYNAEKLVTTTVIAPKPFNTSYANITLSAFDADFPSEGELSINGNAPILLFGDAASNANDQKVSDITISTPVDNWLDGENTLIFSHLDTVGFRIENITVTFSSLNSPTYDPIASLSASNFEFGSQNVGGISAAQVLNITNTGTGDMFISDMMITGDFIETNSCGNLIPVGGTCSINLAFVPSSSGSLSGTLVISDNSANSPHNIQLSGTSSATSNIAATYLSEDFESTDWAQKYSVGNNVFREGGTAARSGSYGIRMHAAAGEHWGGRILFDHSRHGQDGNFTEIWTRYYVRYGATWGSNDGKLGKAGFRARSDEVCGAPCLEMTDSHEVDASGAISGYSYFHRNVSNSSITAKTFEYGRKDWSANGLRDREQWYCVETHHVLNTPTQSDGIYQNWVDGALVSDQQNITQRDTAAANIDNSVLIAYIGGSWKADRDMDIYFDDWAVSGERIGCS